MKTKNLLLGLLCLLTLPTTFIACDDDEFVYYTDMATVTDRDGRWVLESDNCGELIPLNTAALTMHDADKDNQRMWMKRTAATRASNCTTSTGY